MIIQGGGDYLLAVKENQGHLFDDIQFLFETDAKYEFEQVAHSYTKTINKGHGRIEVRECWAIDNEEYLNQLQGRENWIGLKSIVRIVSQRQIGEQVENKTRYFISSLPAKAKTILKAKRSHWKVGESTSLGVRYCFSGR